MTEQKRCPWCAEMIRARAVKCRYCGSLIEPGRLGDRAAPWPRRHEQRMLAGVCAGIADQLGVSVTVVRWAFVLALLFSGGLAVVLYVALWIAMPREPDLLDDWLDRD
jgi:phage shock protein PspC (stress-responsive transcriptional regulator)